MSGGPRSAGREEGQGKGRAELDENWMRAAFREASAARSLGEVPVGAIIVHQGEMIAAAHNRTVTTQDPTAHAEMLALRDASAQLESWRLNECTLYVTLEPCAMCAGAMVLARLGRVVFGAWDDKAGMAGSIGDLLRHPRLNHRPQVSGGVLERECGELLREFFRERRSQSVDAPSVPD